MPTSGRRATSSQRRHTRRVGPAFCALVVLLVACGPRRIDLPTGPGAPFPDHATVHAQLSEACRGVRTLTAELGLSGRAGDQRLRGRVIAGFERPASMRLEAVAPLGQPVFILAARGGSATLLFPRESRVVRGESPEAVLGALTGVALAPADLQAILTGCVLAAPAATGGRLHEDDWAAIEISSDGAPGMATLYLRRQNGAWQLRAARRDGWQIEYLDWQGRFPSAVRLRSDTSDVPVDLTTELRQLEANVEIDAVAFSIDAPPGARPLSIEELREAGPLRGD